MQKKQQNQKQKIAASKGCRITWQPTLWARLEVGDHQLFAILTTWNTKQIRKSIGNILYCKYYIICYASYPFIEPVLSSISGPIFLETFSREFDVRLLSKSHWFCLEKLMTDLVQQRDLQSHSKRQTLVFRWSCRTKKISEGPKISTKMDIIHKMPIRP